MTTTKDWLPLAFGLALTLAACGDGESDVYNLPLPREPFARTDSAVYQMTGIGGATEEVVQVTYTNLASAPLFYARCRPGNDTPIYGVARAGIDSAVPFFQDWVPSCVGGVSTGKLEGGESLTFTVSFNTSASSAVPIEQRSGTVRIEIRACQRHRSESGYCDPPLYDESGTSNEFTLLPPPPEPASE